MKTIKGIRVIESIDDFLHDNTLANEFYQWQSEKSSDFINEPERAARCYDAASDGCDGSYHCEVIDDFREFGRDLLSKAWNSISDVLTDADYTDSEFAQCELEYEECSSAFESRCNELEAWHIANGSYEEQRG